MTNKQVRGDRIIAFAVMIQSLLVIMQIVMVDFFYMSENDTTIYRVVLTAIPMVMAIMVAFVRKPSRIFVGYLLLSLLLAYTVIAFPDNTPYVMSQGLRFLLPVVFPSFLCLTVIYDFSVIEKMLYIVSWISFALVLLILIGFITGIVAFTAYNMAFSFACVVPFVVLYSHRRYYDWVACIMLFVIVIATGARGPVLCMALYVVLDLFQHKSKWRGLALVFIVAFVFLLPMLNQWLGSLGVSSRTLGMLLSGDITQDSGRSTIRGYFITKLMEQPIWGLGLFGDRFMEDVPYCHNLFLEIIIDFGIPVGVVIIIWGLTKLINIYRRADSEKKNQIIKYFCAFVMPFITSSSYLIDSGIAIFIGLCYLINKEERILKCQVRSRTAQ